MNKLGQRHSIVFSILAVSLAVVLIFFLDAGLTYLKLSELSNRLIVEFAFCAYVIWLLTSLGWWREAGFKHTTSLRKLSACFPLLFLPILVTVTSGFKTARAGQMVWFGMLTLTVGFAEEGLVRGVVLRALVSGGVRRAVLLSSLFFGISHVVNLLQGASAAATLVQIIYATFLGIGFAGMCLYTGTIWPAILLHALIDFVDIASRGFVLTPPRSLSLAGVIAPIVLTGLFALYGWWLVRRTAMNSSAA